MQRTLEQELMLDLDQVAAYNTAQRDWGIEGFLYLYDRYCGINNGSIIDLGTGTGQYVIALKEKYPELKIQCVDASEAMVSTSKKNFASKGLDIEIVCDRFENISTNSDLVISTNTIHHIPDPDLFWQTVKRISENVFVMDLVRPDSESQASSIVELTSSNESDIFKTDFYNSLLAAFSVDELIEQIKGTRLRLSIEEGTTGLKVAVIYGQV